MGATVGLLPYVTYSVATISLLHDHMSRHFKKFHALIQNKAYALVH